MNKLALSFLFALRKIRFIPKMEGLMMKLMRYIPAFSDHEVTVEAFDGIKMKLSLNDLVQQHLFAHGYYEPEATELWKYYVANSATVMDIGANVGYYSLLAAKYGSDQTQVYSFEPMKHIYQRAKENIDLNNLHSIHLNNFALSNKKSTETIVLESKSNWGGSNIIESIPDDNVYSEEIKTEVPDQFIEANGLSNIDLIKMDVEGYEMFVLLGMKNTISRCHPLVFIEVLDNLLERFGLTPQDIFDFFRDMGYNGYMILPGRKIEPIKKAISFDGLLLFAHNTDIRVKKQIVA